MYFKTMFIVSMSNILSELSPLNSMLTVVHNSRNLKQVSLVLSKSKLCKDQQFV